MVTVNEAQAGGAASQAWIDTGAAYPAACAHELFEQQATRSPDAVAVVFQDRRLTYRQLDERANQVAHHLRGLGVGPEALVGVSLKRCPELVVALLGVWKAGAAYVPLDPTYPPDRLAFMVEDAGIQVLLTEAASVGLFPSAAGRAICLDTGWPAIAREPMTRPAAGATPANLAYVMYTSGSTGQPKGAMILHRGLVNYLWWAVRAYGVEAGGSVPVHSSISFDLTVTSLYPTLLAGGHAELLPEDAGAQQLVAALRRSPGRSLVKITPAHLDLLRQVLAPEEAAGLTQVFVIGGENLTAENLQLWRDFAPQTRLINEYGPTETVVGCCVYQVQPGDPRSGSVPIGLPIANTQLHILDERLQPVSPGEMGELYIGGDGVARGYHARPELTAERFLPDRFSGREGARLYKTGDLARRRPDGILEYLGRIDHQVKIRGYRIELGEIEATLAGHPAVEACAVLAREDVPGDRQLVGYLVARDGEARAVEDVADFLAQRLPEYMVPAQFVLLEAFPLTQNGKLDRKALPAPDPATTLKPRLYVAPRNDVEIGLATAWEQVLHLPRVGITDNFFDLGGTSLSVFKLLAAIKSATGLDVDLGSVFQYPTIAELVESLGSDAIKAASALVPLQTEGRGKPVFCLCGVNIYREFARSLGEDQPVYGVYVAEEQALADQSLRGEHLDVSIERLAAAYHEAITRASPQGPYRLAGLSFGGVLAVQVASMMRQRGAEVEVVLLLDTWLPQGFRRNWLKWAGIQLGNLARGNLGPLRRKLSRLRDRLSGRGATQGVTAKTVYEAFELRQAAFRQAMAAWDTQRLILDFDVVLFRVSVHDWGEHVEFDEDYGWRSYLSRPPRVVRVGGDHMSLIAPPHVADLGKIARQSLR